MGDEQQKLQLLLLSLTFKFYLWLKKRRQNREKRRRRIRLHMLTMLSAYRRNTARMYTLHNFPKPKNTLGPKRDWVKKTTRSEELKNKLLDGHWNSQDYIDNLRINKSAFEFLCENLHEDLLTLDTTFRQATPTPIKIAVALYYLAETCSIRTVADHFCIGKTTTWRYLHLFCASMNKRFYRQYIQTPTNQKFDDMAMGFETQFNMINCVGAIDGCHIPIKCPDDDSRFDHFDRKQDYSVVLQGVVDNKGLLWNINIDWPGCVDDTRAFETSVLFKKCNSGQLLPISNTVINDVHIPYYIIGDGGYPLLEWLMKPFPQDTLHSQKKETFNRSLSDARGAVENTFGRLKGRWRRLLKRSDCSLENTKAIVMTCCILHNMCEINNIPFLAEENTDPFPCPQFLPVYNDSNSTPQKIRDELADYCFENKKCLHV